MTDNSAFPYIRSGKRKWNLTFPFVNKENIFGANLSWSKFIQDQSAVDADDIDNAAFKENLLASGNFFSEVWTPTMGGMLPFIFQPDHTNNSSDGFALARFVNNSLKIKQISLNTYSISLDIEEAF